MATTNSSGVSEGRAELSLGVRRRTRKQYLTYKNGTACGAFRLNAEPQGSGENTRRENVSDHLKMTPSGCSMRMKNPSTGVSYPSH